MSDPIQELVARVIAEVFDQRLPELRAAVARRIAQELAAGQKQSSALGIENPSAPLNAATGAIQNAGTQADILTQLLDAAQNFAGRAALFVMRTGAISGW